MITQEHQFSLTSRVEQPCSETVGKSYQDSKLSHRSTSGRFRTNHSLLPWRTRCNCRTQRACFSKLPQPNRVHWTRHQLDLRHQVGAYKLSARRHLILVNSSLSWSQGSETHGITTSLMGRVPRLKAFHKDSLKAPARKEDSMKWSTRQGIKS